MDDVVYSATRRQLHGIAEALIAGPQYREHNTIRLTVWGSGTRSASLGGVRLPIAVEGTELVWPDGRTALTGTAREIAVIAGIEPGPPADVYPDGAGLDLDEPLTIDADATARLLACFALGDRTLRDFCDEEPVLWPEHFDLAVTVDRVNYGVSPGDAGHPGPYAYVGPFEVPDGDFWNAPFGALRPIEDVDFVEALLQFFTDGAEASSSASSHDHNHTD